MCNLPKFNILICRCAGIGRRGRLKICCQQWRMGSSPTTGTNDVSVRTNKQIDTKINQKINLVDFFCVRQACRLANR